jgi:mono/diheme cytochrome c family protein
LATGCEDEFKQPMTLGGQSVTAAQLNHGKEQYVQYCRPCHGDNGDGKGISATGLRPPPRDFTQGLFKFGGTIRKEGGTWTQTLPTDSEMVRIVRGGLHGTAMLPWDIGDADLLDILQYVKTFSPKWQDKDQKIGTPVQMSADPFKGNAQAAIEVGKKVYHAKAQCSGCHPAYVTHQELFDITKEMTGQGATAFSPEMYHSQLKESEYCLEWKPAAPASGQTRDKWIDNRECAKPVRVLPPDFTRDPLRNVRLEKTVQYDRSNYGAKPVDNATTIADLYRTITAGIGGAAMPTWKEALTEEQLWGMVYYVKSLIDMAGTPAAEALRAKLLDPSNLSWTPPAPAPTPAPAAPAPAPAAPTK